MGLALEFALCEYGKSFIYMDGILRRIGDFSWYCFSSFVLLCVCYLLVGVYLYVVMFEHKKGIFSKTWLMESRSNRIQLSEPISYAPKNCCIICTITNSYVNHTIFK